MKSSPGPWKLWDCFEGGWKHGRHDGHIVTDVNGLHVCRINHGIFPLTTAEQEDANAWIIAAAPDLKKVAALAIQACELWEDGLPCADTIAQLHKEAREAYTKANGCNTDAEPPNHLPAGALCPWPPHKEQSQWEPRVMR